MSNAAFIIGTLGQIGLIAALAGVVVAQIVYLARDIRRAR